MFRASYVVLTVTGSVQISFNNSSNSVCSYHYSPLLGGLENMLNLIFICFAHPVSAYSFYMHITLTQFAFTLPPFFSVLFIPFSSLLFVASHHLSLPYLLGLSIMPISLQLLIGPTEILLLSLFLNWNFSFTWLLISTFFFFLLHTLVYVTLQHWPWWRVSPLKNSLKNCVIV